MHGKIIRIEVTTDEPFLTPSYTCIYDATQIRYLLYSVDKEINCVEPIDLLTYEAIMPTLEMMATSQAHYPITLQEFDYPSLGNVAKVAKSRSFYYFLKGEIICNA